MAEDEDKGMLQDFRKRWEKTFTGLDELLDKTVKCSNCGTIQDITKKTCGACGEPLEELAKPYKIAAAEAPMKVLKPTTKKPSGPVKVLKPMQIPILPEKPYKIAVPSKPRKPPKPPKPPEVPEAPKIPIKPSFPKVSVEPKATKVPVTPKPVTKPPARAPLELQAGLVNGTGTTGGAALTLRKSTGLVNGNGLTNGNGLSNGTGLNYNAMKFRQIVRLKLKKRKVL
ncbi:MAG: hypothetical protein KAJ51_02965, partial [Thermoplasmata archaeon]|nr:hypothetical protein [Thermoplasmata archaeon]